MPKVLYTCKYPQSTNPYYLPPVIFTTCSFNPVVKCQTDCAQTYHGSKATSAKCISNIPPTSFSCTYSYQDTAAGVINGGNIGKGIITTDRVNDIPVEKSPTTTQLAEQTLQASAARYITEPTSKKTIKSGVKKTVRFSDTVEVEGTLMKIPPHKSYYRDDKISDSKFKKLRKVFFI